MSEPNPPDARPPRPPLSTVAAILFFLVGAVLLLPGLCALAFVVTYGVSSGTFPGMIVLLWIICFAISAGGIALIARALRR